MEKISKIAAKEVAERIAREAFKNTRKSVYMEIQILCEEILKDQIPQEVIDFCQKWKQYIDARDCVSIHCENKQGETILWVTSVVSFFVPFKMSSLVVSGEYSDKLVEARGKISQFIKERAALQHNIENKLLELGTIERIEKEFPSAAPYVVKNLV